MENGTEAWESRVREMELEHSKVTRELQERLEREKAMHEGSKARKVAAEASLNEAKGQLSMGTFLREKSILGLKEDAVRLEEALRLAGESAAVNTSEWEAAEELSLKTIEALRYNLEDERAAVTLTLTLTLTLIEAWS